jgi:tetratricopeptide (TPR) repeat protein
VWYGSAKSRCEGRVSEQEFKKITWSFGASASHPSQGVYEQLQKAESLRLQGHLDRAITLCQPLVGRYPDYYGALYTLGLIYADKGQYPQALGLLVRAVMLNPRSWKALTALSTTYVALGANEMAAQTLEQARLINPESPEMFATLGEIYRAEREYELASDAFSTALGLDARLDAAAIGLGMCCMQLGRYSESAKIFEGQINRGNRPLVALSALADLPQSLVTVDLLTEIAKASPEKSTNKADFDSAVAFIKAAALDKMGKVDETWELLTSANRTIYLKREQDVRAVNETQLAALEQLKRSKIKPFTDDDPSKAISLFILGPSRSGKTTIEALVATLGGVKRGYENPIVENSVRRTFQLAGLLTERAFDLLPPALDVQCRNLYTEELLRRVGPAKVFTNTHPARIYDAVRIASTLPNVRFVFVKRNVDDNLLRIFMRRYSVGNSYSYDLKAGRQHIDWYNDMIDTLAEKLPTISRVVRYEDVIADPGATLQLVADLCGLPGGHDVFPDFGDDRDCSRPYRALLAAALKQEA